MRNSFPIWTHLSGIAHSDQGRRSTLFLSEVFRNAGGPADVMLEHLVFCMKRDKLSQLREYSGVYFLTRVHAHGSGSLEH